MVCSIYIFFSSFLASPFWMSPSYLQPQWFTWAWSSHLLLVADVYLVTIPCVVFVFYHQPCPPERDVWCWCVILCLQSMKTFVVLLFLVHKDLECLVLSAFFSCLRNIILSAHNKRQWDTCSNHLLVFSLLKCKHLGKLLMLKPTQPCFMEVEMSKWGTWYTKIKPCSRVAAARFGCGI